MKIVVGGIIKKDNKILLIQEAKESCYGMWNIPAGKLEKNEFIKDGALREIKEETGLDAKLDGIIQIGNQTIDDDKLIYIIFSANVENITEGWHTEETLQTKLFTIEEIKNMKDLIRSYDFLSLAIEKILNDEIMPLNLIEEIR